MNYSVVLYRKLIASMLKSCVIRCLFMTLLFHNVHQLYLFQFVFSKRPHPFSMHPVKTMQSFVTMCFLPYLRLQACCKSLHDGVDTKGKFPNPETLTRARYSSFALGLASYVIDTTHPFHRGDLFCSTPMARHQISIYSFNHMFHYFDNLFYQYRRFLQRT